MVLDATDRLQALRAKLAAELARHDAELAIDPEDRGEDNTPSQHPADVAFDLVLRESLLTTSRRLRADLRGVDDALRRVLAGTHGICADCGGPIGAERLEVLPQAIRCVACQRREVRAGAGGR